jgi:hypothetical protein
MLHHVAFVRTDVLEELDDDGGAKFLRNVGSYESHMA